MHLTPYKKFKGDRLMPWGKGTVVSDVKGSVGRRSMLATAGGMNRRLL
jgi:hypothetical protein